MLNKLKFFPILFTTFITLWLRLVNLGYSDYQGDEIKALFLPGGEQDLVGFLYSERRGPLQYFISYLVSWIDPSYQNEFLTRLPHALAGILAIFIFYRLVRLHFGDKVALYSTVFLSLNGLFVGLTRIVQYQAWVLSLSISALYVLSLALTSSRWRIKGIYLGLILWAGAFLAHYEAFFITPAVIFILYLWWRTDSEMAQARKTRNLMLASGLVGLILLLLYLPAFFNISGATQSYWLSRLSGDEEGVKPSSSWLTFKIYNPLVVNYLYITLGLLSIRKIKTAWPVMVWFGLVWFILEVIVYDPGTHIYNYLLPATILLAFGVSTLEEILLRLFGQKIGESLSLFGVAGIFLFLGMLAHFLFIDHTPEYPWEPRSVFGWRIETLDESYQLWLFGFPYNRSWETISQYVSDHESTGYYVTNENKSIAGFYVPYEFNYERSGYYIHIQNPQSFRDKLADDKIRFWTRSYEPIKVIERDGQTVAEIYDMPAGDIQALREEGY